MRSCREGKDEKLCIGSEPGADMGAAMEVGRERMRGDGGRGEDEGEPARAGKGAREKEVRVGRRVSPAIRRTGDAGRLDVGVAKCGGEAENAVRGDIDAAKAGCGGEVAKVFAARELGASTSARIDGDGGPTRGESVSRQVRILEENPHLALTATKAPPLPAVPVAWPSSSCARPRPSERVAPGRSV